MRYSLLIIIPVIILLGCPLKNSGDGDTIQPPTNIIWEEGYFSINFIWDGSEPDYYKLYLKENNSWNLVESYIPVNSHRLFDFKFNRDLNYGISAFYNNRESDITEVETINISSENHRIEGINIGCMEFENSIPIYLDPIPGSYKYHIYRDDQLLATTLIPYFIDNSGEINRVYTYGLNWENLVTGDIGVIIQGGIGFYSTFSDPWESLGERTLLDEIEGSIFKIDSHIDEDIFSIPFSMEDRYLTVDTPSGYSTGYLIINGVETEPFTLPVKDLKIPGEGSCTLRILGVDREDNYNTGYIIKLFDGVVVPPGNLDIVIKNNMANLSWEGDYPVNIYRRENQGEWVPIGESILSNSYSDSIPSTDRDYYYGLEAIDGDRVSIMVESLPVNISNPIVTGLVVKSLFIDNGIILRWNRLNPNYTYHIYRSLTPTDFGEEIGSTKDLTYIDYLSPTLLKDTLYYYRVFWKDSVNGTKGSTPSVSRGGFFSNKIDTREPNNNTRDSSIVENIELGEGISSILYSMAPLVDRDWFSTKVPGRRTTYLSGKGLEGIGIIDIYIGDKLHQSRVFPFRDIELSNQSNRDLTYYFLIKPGQTSENFIESYELKISDF